jgi:hypothetical protein
MLQSVTVNDLIEDFKNNCLLTKTDLRASATTTATTPIKTSKKKLLQYFLQWNIVHETSFTPAPHPTPTH